VNGSWVNNTFWNLISSDVNGSWVNDTVTWQIVNNTINGSWFNISLPLEINVIIVYPGNNSFNIPLQPTLVILVNSSFGHTMNISWYYGFSNDSINFVLGSDSNINNGTYPKLFYQADNRSIEYYWKVIIDDGEGNFANVSSVFTTGGIIGYVSLRSDSWAIIIMAFVICLAVFLFILWKARKDNMNNL
jgi:hypothetical protein